MLARVVRTRREALLRAHHRGLPREDVEDCFGQATLELLARVREGRAFVDDAHAANALAQRLRCRVWDRRRALSGRSPREAAVARATRASTRGRERGWGEEEPDAVDRRADVHRVACAREELSRVRARATALTEPQRLVLASQLSGEDCAKFCARHGWSREKYRKVAQRGRARLRP